MDCIINHIYAFSNVDKEEENEITHDIVKVRFIIYLY